MLKYEMDDNFDRLFSATISDIIYQYVRVIMSDKSTLKHFLQSIILEPILINNELICKKKRC